jgi:hypothetical protein
MKHIKDSFIFYRSFAEAIYNLPDTQTRDNIMQAIIKFVLDGQDSDLQGIEKIVFTLIKPQLEANNKRYENGKKGGRPRLKNKPKENLGETETKPNENVNHNENHNYNYNENDNENYNYNYNENENNNVNYNENVNACVGFLKPSLQSATMDVSNDFCLDDIDGLKDYYIDLQEDHDLSKKIELWIRKTFAGQTVSMNQIKKAVETFRRNSYM